MLISLLTAINNDGQPHLQDRLKQSRDPLELNTYICNLILNAVTALLVRDSEVIAAVAKSPAPAPGRPAYSAPGNHPDYPAIHEIECLRDDQAAFDFVSNNEPFTITVLANPDNRWESKQVKEATGNCVLVQGGEPHQSSVKFHEWQSLFTIS